MRKSEVCELLEEGKSNDRGQSDTEEICLWLPFMRVSYMVENS